MGGWLSAAAARNRPAQRLRKPHCIASLSRLATLSVARMTSSAQSSGPGGVTSRSSERRKLRREALEKYGTIDAIIGYTTWTGLADQVNCGGTAVRFRGQALKVISAP